MANKREEFDLVVFDWDGTLMDSTGNIARALQMSFRVHGLPVPDYYAARYVIGLSLNEAFQYLAPGLAMQHVQEMVHTYKAHYQKVANAPVLYEGVTQWLPRFRKAGYQLAIATGKSRVGLDNVLQHTGLDAYFVTTRTAEETFSKPHPQMLDEISTVLSVEKQHIVVIGDTAYDLQMAINAGCSAVGMSYGAHDISVLQTYKPLHIFDDFHVLGSWLVPE